MPSENIVREQPLFLINVQKNMQCLIFTASSLPMMTTVTLITIFNLDLELLRFQSMVYCYFPSVSLKYGLITLLLQRDVQPLLKQLTLVRILLYFKQLERLLNRQLENPIELLNLWVKLNHHLCNKLLPYNKHLLKKSKLPLRKKRSQLNQNPHLLKKKQ